MFRPLVAMLFVSAFGQGIPWSSSTGDCLPPSCTPVIAAPPPWQDAKPTVLTGTEWSIGKTEVAVRGRVRPGLLIQTLGTATDWDAGIFDVHTGQCIVSFYTKPRASGAPVVWQVEGHSTDWAILPQTRALQCSASLTLPNFSVSKHERAGSTAP